MPDSLSKRDIKNIMRAEQKSGNITRINPGLYRALTRYLLELEEAYHEAYVMKRNTRTLMLVREIDDTKQLIKSIYELRERKILYLAQDIVSGGKPPIINLIPEEKLLLLRLVSVLLETRRQTGIEFHTDVERYVETLAREYSLEKELFFPAQSKETVSPDTHETPAEEPEKGNIPVQASTTGSGEKSTPVVEAAPGQPPEIPPVEKETGRESPGGHESHPEPVPAGAGTLPMKESTEEGREEVMESTTEMPELEEKASDFLREYAVTGTLDSIPQFRGSDLHDYRMDRGEIVTLPRRMAELLERQGKLFIIEQGKI